MGMGMQIKKGIYKERGVWKGTNRMDIKITDQAKAKE